MIINPESKAKAVHVYRIFYNLKAKPIIVNPNAKIGEKAQTNCCQSQSRNIEENLPHFQNLLQKTGSLNPYMLFGLRSFFSLTYLPSEVKEEEELPFFIPPTFL